MLKVVIFATGIVTGAVALPATILYVKPVRNALATLASKAIVATLKKDKEARDKLINLSTDIAEKVILMDEALTRKGRYYHGQ